MLEWNLGTVCSAIGKDAPKGPGASGSLTSQASGGFLEAHRLLGMRTSWKHICGFSLWNSKEATGSRIMGGYQVLFFFFSPQRI